MKTRVAAAVLAVVASITVSGQPRRTTITHANIVDVASGLLLPDRTIVIAGDRIVAVSEGRAVPAGTELVDAAGAYVIPGLWDMHAHVQMSGSSAPALYVANGVTGIRDMGSELDVVLALRDAAAAGRLIGPRVIAAGPILDDAPASFPFRLR